MKPGRTLLILLPLLGFSAMALIGWKLGRGTGKSAAATADLPNQRPARPARHHRAAAGSEAAQRLAAISACRTPAERVRATVDLAKSLSPSQFAVWLDCGWFTLRGGAELMLFTKIIQERWRMEDPEGLLLWSIKRGSDQGGLVVASWAVEDPQRVIDFFKKHPDNGFELRALAEVAKINPTVALQRLQELTAAGISRVEARNASLLVKQLAEKSPAALETALDSFTGDLKTEAEVLVIGGKLKASFAEEFEKLQSRPDGFKLLQSILGSGDNPAGDAMKARILEQMADLPVSWRASIAANPYSLMSTGNAAQWAAADLEGMGFTDQSAQTLRTLVISRMASDQPEQAIQLLGDLDFPAESRTYLLENIFGDLLDKPEKAAKLMALLKSDEDREVARTFLGRNTVRQEVRIGQPAEWLKAMVSLDGTKGDFGEYIAVLRDWDQEKLGALTEQFKDMPDDQKCNLALMVARSGFSNKIPLEAEAIRYLVANPPAAAAKNPNDPFASQTADPIRLASSYIQKMAQDDPAAASDWIQSLPAGDPKLWAQKNLHSLWSQYDPKAADQWMNSLPASTQVQVKSLGEKTGN